MGKKLIITEKPSVAQDYAKVFQVSGRNNGYIENDNYVITWCVGHLVEMVYPEEYDSKYKKWVLEDLPFLPKEYKYGVIKNVSQQYQIVHGLLHREDIDTVYWAGDSGKEGQTIEENIRNFGGVRKGMQELRVWIDSQTEEEIRRGVQEAKPMSDYANLGLSGIMRSIEDYAMGINFSRVMSVKYGKLLNDAAATSSYTAIAVGRVMTCVLGMVVNREREIRNFKETCFYRVVGKFADCELEAEWKAVEGSKYFESPKLYKENGFKEKEDAQNLIYSLDGKNAIVKQLEKGISKKKAPLLFNLAELQAECSKRFKITPEETLQIAQDLYEKKLTTYPRTDARVLTTAVAKEIGKTLNRIKGYEPTQKFVEQIMQSRSYANLARTSYTDDSKVTDHYAIIPTGQLTELHTLNPLQSKVFDLIVRRFLSIFYPAAEFSTVKLEVSIENESFFTSSKVLKSLGYLEVMGKKLDEDENSEDVEPEKENTDEDSYADKQRNGRKLLQLSEQLQVGNEVEVKNFDIKDSKTSPPKRYTSGTMILAMENAGQLIEDEELRAQIKGSGIGTSATRAGIIDKLIRIGYLNLNKKTQVISPENFGEMVYEVVAMTVPALLNPKMTASWEKGLDGITNGTVEMSDYREKLENFIRKETIQIRDYDLTGQIANQISQFTGKGGRGLGARKKIGVTCPVCNGDIVTTPFGYGCSNYKREGNGCKFVIGTIAGKDLTEEECISLIKEGRTGVVNGFTGKNKKKFMAALVMNKTEEGKIEINFDFSQNQPQILDEVVCPDCGGSIIMRGATFGCSNFDVSNPESCKFFIGKIADRELNQTQVKELLGVGRTSTIRGFKGKSGKKFDACLVMEKDEHGKHVIRFDFENTERKKIKDVVCPLCGGEIVQTPFGFGCINYEKDNPSSCRFSIGKMAGKDIPESQIKELLTNGKTGTIRGFTAKNGNKFDARIILDHNEEGKVVGLKFSFDDLEKPKVKDVVCPLCGGEIVKTLFGYGCINYNKDDENSCRFSIGKMAGKDIPEAQVKELLSTGRTSTIRGFKGKTGKKFDARIALSKDENGKVTGLKFDFDDLEQPKLKDAKCPLCGGDIVKTMFGYGCSNYNKGDEEKSCRFSIGKISGVKLNDSQVKQLLMTKKTDVIQGFLSKNGSKFEAPLKLTENGQIVFDFPEKPKATDTNVQCPKCKEKTLKKSQWYYECECGFKVGHTVAQVPITEDVLKELFETGKTRKKVLGFVSKAGNQFDSCLKYEDERISFDFDNPGDEKPEQTQMPWLSSDAELSLENEKNDSVMVVREENTYDDREAYDQMLMNQMMMDEDFEQLAAMEQSLYEQSLADREQYGTMSEKDMNQADYEDSLPWN